MFRSIRILAAALVLTFSVAGQARVQSVTTPYSAFDSQLEMKRGQTFLAFMKKTVKPALDSFEADIQAEMSSAPRQYSKWQTALISKGKGVAIRIDGKNYFFNVGYKDGHEPDDIKSGRSYGVGPTGRQSDPSDVFYLSELEHYLRSEPQHVGDFTRAIMAVITDCDTSGWAKLSVEGQTVATDFLAIYTAELDRHLMVDLAPGRHPWEIDLAAATFVSVFNASTGMMPSAEGENFAFVSGGLRGWWAQGETGSGIGNTRRHRKALTAFIGSVEREQHGDLVSEIEDVTGKLHRSDVIQGVFTYLNSKSAPDQLGADGERLSESFTQFIETIRDDADEILARRN